MLKKIIVFIGLFVAACGFRPLYGNHDEVITESAAIRVEPISGEGGYQFGLILKNRLNPYKTQVSKKYQLKVTLHEPTYVNESMRSDNFASIKNMNIKADYRLTEIKTKKVLITSSVDSQGIFNLIRNPYATVVSEEKLYDNLIQLMAEDIATHVLAYFRGDHP